MGTNNWLPKCDTVINDRANELIKKLSAHDSKSKKPVDRSPYMITFTEFCICKIYGVPEFFDNRSHKNYSQLLIYVYAKVTKQSGSAIAYKMDTHKMEISRSISAINEEKDEKQLQRIRYLTQKLTEFCEKI